MSELFPDGTTEVVHEVFAIVNPTERLLSVVKMTKTQVVALVNGREVRFDRGSGEERGQDYRIGHHSKIVPATDRARDAAQRSAAIDTIQQLAFEAGRWAKDNTHQAKARVTTQNLASAASLLSDALSLLTPAKQPSKEKTDV